MNRTRVAFLLVSIVAAACSKSASKDSKDSPSPKAKDQPPSNAKTGPVKVDAAYLAEIAKTQLDADAAAFMAKHKDEEIVFDGAVFENFADGADFTVEVGEVGAAEGAPLIMCTGATPSAFNPAFKRGDDHLLAPSEAPADNVTVTGKIATPVDGAVELAAGCTVTKR